MSGTFYDYLPHVNLDGTFEVLQAWMYDDRLEYRDENGAVSDTLTEDLDSAFDRLAEEEWSSFWSATEAMRFRVDASRPRERGEGTVQEMDDCNLNAPLCVAAAQLAVGATLDTDPGGGGWEKWTRLPDVTTTKEG